MEEILRCPFCRKKTWLPGSGNDLPRPSPVKRPWGKPGWNGNPMSSGPLLWAHCSVNILATWLYFHRQLKILERNQEWPLSSWDFKIKKRRSLELQSRVLSRNAWHAAKRTVKGWRRYILSLQQPWWHCCSQQTRQWACEKLAQGF